jgi:hypothetical protein
MWEVACYKPVWISSIWSISYGKHDVMLLLQTSTWRFVGKLTSDLSNHQKWKSFCCGSSVNIVTIWEPGFKFTAEWGIFLFTYTISTTSWSSSTSCYLVGAWVKLEVRSSTASISKGQLVTLFIYLFVYSLSCGLFNNINILVYTTPIDNILSEWWLEMYVEKKGCSPLMGDTLHLHLLIGTEETQEEPELL